MTNSNKSIFYRPWENLKEENSQGKTVLRLPDKIVKDLEKKHYGVFGHSGVQICSWTKKSLTGKGVCYKEKFYGISCHSCMEMTPAVMWCQQNCSFCWRPMEFMKNIEIKENEVDEPEEIMENLFAMRKKLLSGFGGNDKVDWEKFKDAQQPSHYAISLSGEPTMYPKLDKMVEYLKSIPKTKSIFIVTNGQIPEFFEKLKMNPNSIPTQLYISLDAPNKQIFEKVNISLYKDGFERLKKSFKIFSRLDTRKVIRFTQIKGLNDLDEHMQGYKELLDIANPDLIEIKAYMHIGMSRGRHNEAQMPTFDEVMSFGKKLANHLGNFEFVDAAPNSRIILLRRVDSKYDVDIAEFEN